MNKFCGLMRVKNEARWIEESLESLLLACGRVFVFDDHSVDGTPEICEKTAGVTLIRSPFSGLNEGRDKAFLLNAARGATAAEWFFFVDGDEVVEKDGGKKLRELLRCPIKDVRVADVTVLYYWNGTDGVRWDKNFKRFEATRVIAPKKEAVFSYGDGPAQLHCGCVPDELLGSSRYMLDLALWHYGYMEAEVRRNKFEWYRANDSGNAREGNYLHILQGDPGGPGPKEELRHGGPLDVLPVGDFLAGVGSAFSPRPRDSRGI